MARRKSKAKQREEFIEDLFKGVALIPLFITYYFTKSFKASIAIALLALALTITILVFNQQRRNDRLIRSGIEEIDKMDGFQFEKYLGLLFKELDYDAKVTKSVGDFGADLIISKAGKKIAVQAKRYAKNVGIKAVQEAQASIAHYGASEAWVVTNSDFTEAARKLAHSNKVRLIDREQLIELILNKDSAPTVSDIVGFKDQKKRKIN